MKAHTSEPYAFAGAALVTVGQSILLAKYELGGIKIMGSRDRGFASIDGVPLFYARSGDGKQRRSTFYGTDELYDRLVIWKRDLDAYTRPAGYGRISRIVSAGAWVDKKGPHGRGAAFDIDQVRWSTGRACSPIRAAHTSTSLEYRLRYFALDAVCRQHFRWVLDGYYNAEHRDHIHVDMDGMPVKLSKKSRSDTVFIQAVCNLFGGYRLSIDGDFGPKTSSALASTVAKAGLGSLNPLRSKKEYQRFMQRVSQNGFRGKRF